MSEEQHTRLVTKGEDKLKQRLTRMEDLIAVLLMITTSNDMEKGAEIPEDIKAWLVSKLPENNPEEAKRNETETQYDIWRELFICQPTLDD